MASYLVVEKSRQELLDEFLAAVRNGREARFSAISSDDPSLSPPLVEFVVSVKELHVAEPMFVDVVDVANSTLAFRIPLFKNVEAVCFDIIM
jgi:hypothetical protein